MSKHNRDVKFIIYQVLYIFVIVVLTMKGADINLQKVMTEEEAVKKTYADSLKKYIDSMLALGLVPKLQLDSLKNIADLKNMIMPPIPQQTSVSGVVIMPGNVQISQEEYEKMKVQQQQQQQETPEQQKQEDQQNIILPTTSLVQFTKNSIKNNGSLPLEVLGDGTLLSTIAPGSTGTFQVMGQRTITYKQGSQTRSVSTKENERPNISITSYAAGGPEASLRMIQSVVSYRVTVSDDYPQYKVTISGPVKFTDAGNGNFDIKLQWASSKQDFENKTANLEAPYRATVTVTVTDPIANHTLQRVLTYTFGDW